ncbi:MAG: ABC transporter ATP-binding protein [Candidatus Doudnabacteria bacterium CG10_big_fil_rev_8_21_14_0_10_41_10]|uniref:ABC transporter ATP-binding protein n=1 Tax=Candidatus Doudnabacteria bacterium CG10_big_fil_rev_8_21_14_0_10_41_10 TaxID=1974551 RepID=A0A2H0VEI9_9BACT|nr:MAG: ABC transporter ATP-binding protein [Candidatus Doudnabacteria bacterium CG10_big_fil_rev_8_21_14_0_10_41_10]
MRSLTRETIKIYWQHGKKYKLALFLMAIGTVGVSGFEVVIPFWYKKLFDTIALNDFALAPELLKIITAVWFLWMGVWLSRRIRDFVTAYFEARMISNLLNTCFDYLHGHSYSFFSNNFVGSLVRKVNRFARSFEEITDQTLIHLGNTGIHVVLVIIILFTRHWILGAGVLIWAIVYIFFGYKYTMFKIRYDREKAAQDSVVTGVMADTVTNQMNLKMFGARDREFENFKKTTDDLYYKQKKAWYLGSFAEAIQGFLMVALEFMVLYIAIKFWQRGLFTIGDFALLQSFVIGLFSRLWNIGNSIRRVFERFADADEMTEILITPHGVKDLPRTKNLLVTNARINFKDVSFGYHDELMVFDKFNLEIKPGERTALIGTSGGGKSTIVKLLLRFHDINSGQILIDGQNIANFNQNSLRRSIAMVPQDPILFHRSLMENIRYARPEATKEEVIRAAKLAHAHKFIIKFPQGYETFVGERGIKLSGGERQRVAIARAIIKNAPILILDEATSSLDSESEKFIQDAMKKLMNNRTTIVIAHRLSTIMQMDRIVVIEDGKVKEQGKHKELLKAHKGTYQRLWEIQAGGFA